MESGGGLLKPTLVKLEAIAIFCAGWGATWVFGLAMLWLLAMDTSNSVAITWSMWRIPDTILIFINIMVFFMQGSRSNTGVIFVGALIVGTILVDVVSLTMFIFHYMSCLDDLKDMETVTDPLCMTSRLKTIGAYHIVIMASLTACAGFNILLVLMMHGLNSPTAIKGPGIMDRQYFQNTLVHEKARKFVKHAIINIVLTIILGAVVLLVVEATVLTPSSNIKYAWFAHILLFPPAILIFPQFLTNPRINQIMTILCAVAILGSGAGLAFMAPYDSYLCETDPPRKYLLTYTTCELGLAGARFFVAFHAAGVLIAILRLVNYFFILRLDRMVATREASDAIEGIDSDLLSQGGSEASAGKLRQRGAHLADGSLIYT